jgi:uroporphyrinogen-III synthase
MRVLVTRPEEDAQRTASLLKARGHEVIIAPLLTVRFHDGPEIPLDGVQAMLATSANGVRSLAMRTARRDVPVFAVGPQTAEEALRLGFATVRNARGDVHALAAATARWASRPKGPLLHVKGEEADGTLAELLTARGFEVRSVVLYDVAAAVKLPAAVRNLLDGKRIDAALFFSARSARVFRDCGNGLDVSSLIAVCISEAAAAALAPLAFREVRVAFEPNQNSVLACLD